MDLFVYGTLMSATLMEAVAGPGNLEARSATLRGYRRHPLRDNVVPFIVADAGATTDGTLWTDLTDQQIARLDVYERAFGYELSPVTVEVDGMPVAAQTYLPTTRNAPGPGDWSLETWEEGHLAPAVLAAAELFSHRPLPDHGELRGMWPMIENRAWAKHRAAAAPATVRRAPEPGDFQFVAQRPPLGSFYRLQSLDITHQRFDRKQSHVLVREAFLGVDAAMILPYDPARDRVLLVEQARLGPAARQDPNPWMLEPIAGIIDARETPQEAARREMIEEAGVEPQELLPAGQYYPSPGSSTDYFYCFVGLCDLPRTQSWLGGLEQENEDLRLHPLSFGQALALAESGEIATGPLHHLLYWLAYHRDRLRGMD